MGGQLLIAEEAEGLHPVAEALAQPPRFFEPARVEHLLDPLLDALVERFALRQQPELHHSVTFQAVASFAEKLGARAARLEPDLQCANELGRIARSNLPR